MISLNVEEKCQNCPHFQPIVKWEYRTTEDKEKVFVQTVECEHKEFCGKIYKYLKNEEVILDKNKRNGVFPGNQNKGNYNWNMPGKRK